MVQWPISFGRRVLYASYHQETVQLHSVNKSRFCKPTPQRSRSYSNSPSYCCCCITLHIKARFPLAWILFMITPCVCACVCVCTLETGYRLNNYWAENMQGNIEIFHCDRFTCNSAFRIWRNLLHCEYVLLHNTSPDIDMIFFNPENNFKFLSCKQFDFHV